MTRPLALVCSAAFLLTSQAASAKPRVALTPIEGDSSGDIRDAVAEALEGKDLALIGSKEVNRAVDKLGDLADLTEKDFKKLANELEADAVVAGKLDKVGRSRTLKFRLFIHKKMAKGFTVSFKDASSEKFRSMLHDKMVDKIGVASDGEDDQAVKKRASEDDEDPLAKKMGKKMGKKARAEDEEESRPARKARAEDEDARPAKKRVAEEDDARPARKARAEDDEEARPARKKAAEGDDTAASQDSSARPDGETEEAPRKAKKKVAAADDGDEVESGVATRALPTRGANRFAVRLDVGVSVQQRTFTFNSRPDFLEKPKGSNLSPVPGARFEAELYPLAFSNPGGVLGSLGIGVEYDRTLSLEVGSSNEPMVKAPVKQSHYSLGLRYRLAFGSSATSPTLTLGAGYGKRLFSPDTSPLTMDAAREDIRRDAPSTHYVVIDPGLMFRFPVTRMIAFSAGGRGMIVTNAGSIQNLSSYGRAKVWGFEGIGAVDVVLGDRFALRFAGELVQIGFTFTGVGDLSNNLDGNSSTEDVGGLADRAIGGSATLAVMY